MIRYFLYIAAALAFLSFWTAGFKEPSNSGMYLVASLFLFVSSLICWIGSIYVWAVAYRQGRSSVLSLIVLVPLGFLCGWLYVLVRGGELRRSLPA